MLLALVAIPQALAVPTSYADVYFRRTIQNPFTDPGYFESLTLGDAVTLDRSRSGSQARFEGNAANGSLHAFAQAVPAFDGGQEAWARGHIDDRFTVTGASDGTPLRIKVSYTVDGLLQGVGSAPMTLAAYSNAYVASQFIAGSANVRREQWARSELQLIDCWVGGCPGFSIPIHWVDEFELDVVAGAPFDIHYGLDARGGWAFGGSLGTSDFGSTASLSFTLPAGLRVSSLGGFVQSGAGNGVPEPAAWALLAVGLLGMALRGGARKGPSAS